METRLRSAGIWIVDGAVLLKALAGRDEWSVPGSWLQPDESLVSGCVRDYTEVLGIAMHPEKLLVVNENFWSNGDASYREYGFYFRVAPDQPINGRPIVKSSEPHITYGWFALTKLREMPINPPVIGALLPSLDDTQTIFLQSRG